MARNSILEKLGIVRHVFMKDLIFFFIPFFGVFILQLHLCGKYGVGLRGIWGVIWEVIRRPSELFALPWHRMIGLSLFVVGLTIMIVGQITLWRNYSGFVVIKKDHQLIRRGVYRYTRNPIYLGLIMVVTGLPVYAASVYGLLAVFPEIPILLFRIKMEEKLLAEHFGEEYEAYRSSTKRLIPFLY